MNIDTAQARLFKHFLRQDLAESDNHDQIRSKPPE
jgi:hypothetical protein